MMKTLPLIIWRWLSLLIIAGVMLFVARPALHGGLFQSDDDVQVTRIMAMHDEIKNGQFPVRYIDSFGNGGGYFLFNFYSPFVYYLGSGLVFLGLSYLQAVKLVFLIYIFLGSVGIFMLLKSQTSWAASIWGTCLFLLSPYVFHDLFHRGALAESAGFLICPFVLWSFLKLKKLKSKWSFIISALSFGTLVVTHILTGAMMGATILIWMIVSRANTKEWIINLLALGIGLCLAGFYFFPAILESNLVRYAQTEPVLRGYISQFVELNQQLGLNQAIAHKKSFLGLGLMLTFLLTLILQLKKTASDKHKISLLKSINLITGVGLLLMMNISTSLWATFSLIRYLQFPYRILTILVVLLSLGFSLGFDLIKPKWQKTLLVLIVIVLPTIFYLSYYSVKSYQYIPEYKVEGKCKTTSWEDEHMPKTVHDCLPSDHNQPLVKSLNNRVEITNINSTRHNRQITFDVNGKNDMIEVTKYYFPGWTATNDLGQMIEITPSDKYGLINFKIDQEFRGRISLELKSTPVRTFGNWLTIVSALILLWLAFMPLPPPIRLPKVKE